MKATIKGKFFDDPFSNVKSWLLHVEQQSMRSVISRKYEGILDPQVYWIKGTDTEDDGLSSDRLERLVQRLSLSQIGVFLAQRIWARRTWLMTPALLLIGLLLAYVLLSKAGTTTNDKLIPLVFTGTIWLSALICFSGTVFSSLVAQVLLPKTPVRQDEIDAVKSVISRCVVRDTDSDTPPDLADRARLLVTDANGRSVAGQVLATDLEYSAVRAEWMTTKAVLLMLGLVMLSPVFAVASPVLALLNYFALLAWKRLAFWIPRADDQPQQGPAKGDPSVLVFAIKFALVPLLILIGLTASYREHLDTFVRLDAELIQWAYVIGMWAFAIYLALTAKSPSPFEP